MAILYTTHYMEEAERLCDRVGIIDGGEIRAEGTRKELVALIGERDQRAALARGRRRWRRPRGRGSASPGVASAAAKGDVLEVLADDAGRGRSRGCSRRSRRPARRCAASSCSQPNLEAVFLHLTGRALRDAE